ncbi:MAG: tRNA (adenosine(37)-N6)-dimethylallyltransferase MiaA [Actinobacteria bacterium]|nr:MAG: tRNA (adenosine(37)-N6)-dimethylallyltransferase MiaA [Actinomycetota bacterium]TMK93633.1 MAG: tRNA (adenosine(37)-N6)-dimethylallyltransferase MiaA [Actinomycetota bacterium]TMM25019.1 MAG: tRNA (adenosine(37)-N6)-dimethylallyltransferase MiaA [Actinomycetota bacterium]
MAMLALVGPTASGKSDAALAIAPRLGAEVVSVDSMLVYRGMDIGTAKPTIEQRAVVPHHLLDLAEPSERFTVARYQELARGALRSIARPLLVGGSGLYLRAVVDDLAFPPEDPVVRASLEAEADDLGADALYHRLADTDPVAAARIEPGNVRRIIRALEVTAISGSPFSSFATAWDRYDADRVRAAGIRMNREARRIRIGERVLAMLRNGWLDEVQGLLDRGFGGWITASRAIGYAELAEHLDGRVSLDEAAERTVKRTRELARRQMAWFRRDPRIRWFDVGVGGASEVADDVCAYLGSA